VPEIITRSQATKFSRAVYHHFLSQLDKVIEIYTVVISIDYKTCRVGEKTVLSRFLQKFLSTVFVDPDIAALANFMQFTAVLFDCTLKILRKTRATGKLLL
jgi:hypothetical protein